MSTAKPDQELEHRNIARFCVEHRQIALALLAAVVLWGILGYQDMPKRKDPAIPVRIALAVTPWPGHSAVEIENLVTRAVEQKIAESSHLNPPSPRAFGIRSLTLPGVSFVQVQLDPRSDPDAAFNDINLKLADLNDQLPPGAGPVTLNSGFGETSAIMLTVASPKADHNELALRAQDIQRAINKVRASRSNAQRASLVVALPLKVDTGTVRRGFHTISEAFQSRQLGTDFMLLSGSGYVGMDFSTSASDHEILDALQAALSERLGLDQLYPDAWQAAVIRDPATTLRQLTAVAGDKYSYRQLDDFSDIIATNLNKVPQVSKVIRSGILEQRVFLDYSQEQLASYGIRPADIRNILQDRNSTVPGGVIEVDGVNLVVSPSGQFTAVEQIGDVIVNPAVDEPPVYLRSLVDVRRAYQSPPGQLNFYVYPDKHGSWQRSRAITVSLQMHEGEQIGQLGEAVDQSLAQLRSGLPDDLIIVRTTDQPRQVAENIGLFMRALYEAVALVVLVSLIGFWQWRPALLLMISIPITLAMTFGMIHALGLELQQVSIAALIIALGLLVDDPVVASDAIKRSLADGYKRAIATWLGPTKLAEAILFATITNIVAYLPLLLLTGNQGTFLQSLPIVMTCALIASRIVSMTFVPLLGYYLLRPDSKPPKTIEERRTAGFTGWYYRLGQRAIEHRKLVLLLSLSILAAGVMTKRNLSTAFFPEDVQYLAYVDVWLDNSASIDSTAGIVQQVETLVQQESRRFAQQHGYHNDEGELLESISSNIGGSPPRFWFTINPEQRQPNYAQVILRFRDKTLTPAIAPYLNSVLSSQIPGAFIEVKQLQTTPLDFPVAVRISSQIAVTGDNEAESNRALRHAAAQVAAIITTSPAARGVRDDWGTASLVYRLDIDPDRANLAGVSNQDIAASSATAISGMQVGTLREGERQIPIVARLRSSQRAQLSDMDNLYVYSMKDSDKVPLLQVASTRLSMETERVRRLERMRTITVSAYPAPGFLASDVMGDVGDQLAALKNRLPPGIAIEISGEQANTEHGFGQLLRIMLLSAAAIYMALVFQFNSLIKPLIVFAAVPYGIVGALVALYIAGQAFGFMAFLAIVSLIGIIVSHVIVLFDFIEARHAAGDGLKEALLDAGIIRLRPVMITVGATVLALVPLARDGGPLWQPLCFAQIGGLLFATVVTLLLVPVIYSILVLDLKWINWGSATMHDQSVNEVS